MFKSINEIDNFSFDDCVFAGFTQAEDGLVAELEALIVKANNSQNSNFTDSYAGTTQCKMIGGRITQIMKAGYRYYDADGKLIRSVEDEEVSKLEWDSLLTKMKGSYLAACEKDENGYLLEIEMCEEDGAGDTYLCSVECGDIIFTWERYMNRVQK